jgi:hypothetical protein
VWFYSVKSKEENGPMRTKCRRLTEYKNFSVHRYSITFFHLFNISTQVRYRRNEERKASQHIHPRRRRRRLLTRRWRRANKITATVNHRRTFAHITAFARDTRRPVAAAPYRPTKRKTTKKGSKSSVDRVSQGRCVSSSSMAFIHHE